MGLFDKLRTTLAGKPGEPTSRDVYQFRVRCRRCGEELHGEVNLSNDLSQDYERDVYFVRKLISGSGANRCFQQIEVQLTFDSNKQILEREITGGVFVEEPAAEPVAG